MFASSILSPSLAMHKQSKTFPSFAIFVASVLVERFCRSQAKCTSTVGLIQNINERNNISSLPQVYKKQLDVAEHKSCLSEINVAVKCSRLKNVNN